MIIIKLAGGLGNQLFQYSLGRHLAKNQQTILKMDISNFKNDTLRDYALGVFKIKEIFATTEEINSFKKKGLGKKFNSFLPYPLKYYIQENESAFEKKIFTTKNNIYIDGYWQSEKYFKAIENDIRQEITLKEPLGEKCLEIVKKITETNSISIHIRHGDYLNDKLSKIFEICSPEYYTQAISLMAKKIEQPYFFIFSDDIAWAEKNLKTNFPIEYVSKNKFEDYKELVLMGMCKHNIIANSSFSWWGAWLNNNHQKIVIAPKTWFKDPAKIIKDIIPDSWIKL